MPYVVGIVLSLGVALLARPRQRKYLVGTKRARRTMALFRSDKLNAMWPSAPAERSKASRGRNDIYIPVGKTNQLR